MGNEFLKRNIFQLQVGAVGQKCCFITAVDFRSSDIYQLVEKQQCASFIRVKQNVSGSFMFATRSLNGFANSLLKPFELNWLYHIVDGIKIKCIGCIVFVSGGENYGFIFQ